jgi:hypothetical protein
VWAWHLQARDPLRFETGPGCRQGALFFFSFSSGEMGVQPGSDPAFAGWGMGFPAGKDELVVCVGRLDIFLYVRSHASAVVGVSSRVVNGLPLIARDPYFFGDLFLVLPSLLSP